MATWRLPVALTYDLGGGPGVNVWHLRNTGEPFDDDVQECVDAIHAFYSTVASGAIAGADGYQAGMRISADTVINVDSDESASVDWDTITVPATGDVAPPVLALCMTWRTSIAARRGRGRSFMGPLSQNALQDNGTPAEDFRAVHVGAAQDLVDFNDGFDNGAVVVYGRTAIGSSTHVARDITGFSVPNEFAIMRSRRD